MQRQTHVAAPAVYRPTHASASRQNGTSFARVGSSVPACQAGAPPVYRPTASTQPFTSHSGAGQRSPFSCPGPPPVYRPVATAGKVAQRQTHAAAPAVYRPTRALASPRNGTSLARVGSSVPACPAGAPPVYRPTVSSSPLFGQTGAAQPSSLHRLASPPVYRPGSVSPPSTPQQSVGQLSTSVLAAPPVYRHPLAVPVQRWVAPAPSAPSTPSRSPVPVPQPSRTPGRPGFGTIQRTTWRFDKTNWVMDSSSSSDTDTHAAPGAYCVTNGVKAKEHDRYDQNTGVYYPFAAFSGLLSKAEASASKKKVPANLKKQFPERGKRTAYSHFYETLSGEVRSNLQGPHVLSFSAKQAMAHMAEKKGKSIEQLVDSKLLPRPRRALKILQDLMKAKNITLDLSAQRDWYQEYKQAYKEASDTTNKPHVRRNAAREAIELHPLTVYRLGERATATEMAGKGERMQHAFVDLRNVSSSPWSPIDTSSTLSSVDLGYLATEPAAFHIHYDDMARNWFRYGRGEPPSPSPYDDAPASP